MPAGENADRAMSGKQTFRYGPRSAVILPAPPPCCGLMVPRTAPPAPDLRRPFGFVRHLSFWRDVLALNQRAGV